jgi:hypothetical protein
MSALAFTRCDELIGISACYAHPSLRPGRYRVISRVVGDFCDFPTVLGFVVLYRGRLLRCWLH